VTGGTTVARDALMSKRPFLSLCLLAAASPWLLTILGGCGGKSTAASDGAGGSSSSSSSSGMVACRADSDCTGFDAGAGQPVNCFGPYYGCGGIEVCTADTDCSAGQVCTVKVDGDPLSCRTPCADDDACPPTYACTTDGHCEARTSANCPTYLKTTPGGNCEAQACAADSDCPGGYCVDGTCSGRLGFCALLCE
jgi:hypothetical protein